MDSLSVVKVVLPLFLIVATIGKGFERNNKAKLYSPACYLIINFMIENR